MKIEWENRYQDELLKIASNKTNTLRPKGNYRVNTIYRLVQTGYLVKNADIDREDYNPTNSVTIACPYRSA